MANDKLIVLGHSKFSTANKTYYKVFFAAKLGDKLADNVNGYECDNCLTTEEIYNTFSKCKPYTELEAIILRKFQKYTVQTAQGPKENTLVRLEINRLL